MCNGSVRKYAVAETAVRENAASETEVDCQKLLCLGEIVCCRRGRRALWAE